MKEMNTKHLTVFSLQDITPPETYTYKVHNFYHSEFFRNIPPKPCRKVLAKFLSIFSTKNALRNLAESLQGRGMEHSWNGEGPLWMLWSHRRMKRNIYCSHHLTKDLGGICNHSLRRLAKSVPNTH